MLGLLAPTIIALAAALARGGSLRTLVSSGIAGWPLVIACFGVELALYNPPLNAHAWAMQFGPWIWLATRLVFVWVLIANAWPVRRALAWPAWLAAFGLALNTLVIALNDGHMPRSTEAAMLVWGGLHVDATRLQNVIPISPATRLPWLGDIFAEPTWLPRANVISPGDILLALGVACWVFARATRAQPVTSEVTASKA